MLPKFRVGMAELVPGLDIRIGDAQIDLSFIGVWGKKATTIGRIYTGGVGGRFTLWWRFWQHHRFSMRLGPSVEGLVVWGSGREGDQAESSTAVAPVVNLLLTLGGSLTLTPRLDVAIAVGGGGTVLFFEAQAAGNDASGMAGGIATLVVGIDFGRSKGTK